MMCVRMESLNYNVGLIARQAVFGVYYQVMLKLACSAIETSKTIDSLHITKYLQ